MGRGLWAGLVLLGACVPASYDRDLVTQLDREILALKERNKVVSGKLENCDVDGNPGPIYAELVQVFSGTDVRVSKHGMRTVVVIPADRLFGRLGSQLREEAIMVPDMLATALQLHDDKHVWVIAHTDDEELSGSSRRRYGSLWGLSMAQATGFMVSLVELGVAERRFTIAGRGGQEPVAETDTPEGRASNRRLVVVIGPPDDFE